MEDWGRCTPEHGLLFPLKAGLFALRSSQQDVNDSGSDSLRDNSYKRDRVRRGSSLIDLSRPQIVKTFTSGNSYPATPTATPRSSHTLLPGQNLSEVYFFNYYLL